MRKTKKNGICQVNFFAKNRSFNRKIFSARIQNGLLQAYDRWTQQKIKREYVMSKTSMVVMAGGWNAENGMVVYDSETWIWRWRYLEQSVVGVIFRPRGMLHICGSAEARWAFNPGMACAFCLMHLQTAALTGPFDCALSDLTLAQHCGDGDWPFPSR